VDVSVPRVSGGYKALRTHAIRILEEFAAGHDVLVLSGRTGSGKSRLLRSLALAGNTIDLERYARHTGSSFGGLFGVQPAQATFENEVAFRCLQRMKLCGGPSVLEDEARKIGMLRVPPALYERMARAPRFILEVGMEERIENIIEDYVSGSLERFRQHEKPLLALESYLQTSVRRISNSLGGARTAECLKLIELAIQSHSLSGSTRAHGEWIRFLLVEYYDPRYDFDLGRKPGPVVHRAGAGALEALLTVLSTADGRSAGASSFAAHNSIAAHS
jgi:tRNA 2-selenouridine synthase